MIIEEKSYSGFIQVFSKNGVLLKSFANEIISGCGVMTFDLQGNLILADTKKNRVFIFDPLLNLKTQFGEKGRRGGQFHLKYSGEGGVAVGNDGNIVMSDHGM